MRIFTEEQRFRQTWLIVMMLLCGLFSIGIIINEYLKQTNTMSLVELFVIITIISMAAVLIFLLKLKTRIDEKGIHYKFFPFHLKFKTVHWQDISNIYTRKYDAISEYGGWGIKGSFFWKKNKSIAINVSGDIGIQLELNTGKKLLIGTKKQNDIESIIKTYKSKLKSHEIND